MCMTGASSLSRTIGWKGIKRKLIKSMPYYLLILLPLSYMLVFRYYPMLGAQIAFKDYKVRLGIWASPWAPCSSTTPCAWRWSAACAR